MHIGGFNFLQQNKTTAAASGTSENTSDVVSAATGVLKEFNKNTTSSDNYKANKKYKYGHVNKSFEPSSAYGKCLHSFAPWQVYKLTFSLVCHVDKFNSWPFTINCLTYSSLRVRRRKSIWTAEKSVRTKAIECQCAKQRRFLCLGSRRSSQLSANNKTSAPAWRTDGKFSHGEPGESSQHAARWGRKETLTN